MMPACACEGHGCPYGVQPPDGKYEHCFECIKAGCVWGEPCKRLACDEPVPATEPAAP